jgi:putative transposase
MMRSGHRRSYPSDLTETQWQHIASHIPEPDPVGRPSTVERRELVNAILYVLRSGCPWRLLPHDLPKWQTVYYYFRRWQREGVWLRVMKSLHVQVRQQAGREPDPSAACVDSQSIKTSPVRGIERGFDAWKKNLGPETTRAC